MENLPVDYNITDAALEELKKTHVPSKVTNNAELKDMKADIAFIKSIRVGLEKSRVEKKKDALAYGKRVDTEAKRIKGILVSIETPLIAEKDIYEAEKAKAKRIKEQAIIKEQERVDAIKNTIGDYKNVPDRNLTSTVEKINRVIDVLMDINLDFFAEFRDEAIQAIDDTIVKLKELRTKREQWEQEQADQLAIKEENARVLAKIEEAQAKFALEMEQVKAEDKKQRREELEEFKQEDEESIKKETPVKLVKKVKKDVIQAVESRDNQRLLITNQGLFDNAQEMFDILNDLWNQGLILGRLDYERIGTVLDKIKNSNEHE